MMHTKQTEEFKRFTIQDETGRTPESREAERRIIAEQIEHFLAGGGQITYIEPMQDSVDWSSPHIKAAKARANALKSDSSKRISEQDELRSAIAYLCKTLGGIAAVSKATGVNHMSLAGYRDSERYAQRRNYARIIAAYNAVKKD